MRKTKLSALILALLTLLASCSAPDLGIIGGADGPTVTVVGKITDDTVAIPETESRTEPADTMPEMPDKDFTELDGDLQFYRFDEGNAAVVWNESGAWVFDFVLDKVVPIFDNAAIIEDVDYRGEGAEYFTDTELSLEFYPNKEIELRIVYNVRSKSGDARYSAYAFYPLNSPLGQARGELRGYYLNEIVYPGSDIPVTVDDVSHIGQLGGREDNYVAELAKAVATLDLAEMERQMALAEGTLDSWKSVKIDGYTISRSDFSYEDILWLELTLNITESGLERLPAGKYKVDISEGMSFPNVEFTRLDVDAPAKAEMTAAEKWLLPWVTHYGGYHPIDTHKLSDSAYTHKLVDFYLFLCANGRGEPKYEDFISFTKESFGYNSTASFVSRDEVENHGGHGGATVLCELRETLSASGIHKITVDFFADPMRTVVARTHEFTLVENNGTFFIDSVQCTYDTGYGVKGWST